MVLRLQKSSLYSLRAIVLLTSLLVNACDSGPFESTDHSDTNTDHSNKIDVSQANSLQKPLEKMDLELSGSTIFMRVLSNGCTKAEHFIITKVETAQCEYVLTRSRPDFCKRATSPVNLSLNWQPPVDCRVDEIVFSNPPLSEK